MDRATATPGKGEGLAHRDIAASECHSGRRAECPGPPTGCDDPDVRGCIGRAADQGQPLTVRAQRGDGDAGLLQLDRGRRPAPASLVQPDQGIPSRRRPAGDERAVGGLVHGALAEHPVGSVEFRCHIRQRRRLGRHVRGADKAIGQPPTAPVGDEAQRSVAAPGGLADRLGGPAGHLMRRPHRHQGLVAVRRAGDPGERDDQDRRGIPRHVRVIPGDHGDAATGRIGARRAEEVEILEKRALTRRRAPRGQRNHPAHRTAGSWAVDLADGQHPVAVLGGAEPAVVVDLPVRGRPRQRPRRCAGALVILHGGAVAEPHPPVRLVHVGEGTGRSLRHQAHGPPAVLVHPAADAHALGRVVGQAIGIGPHQHHPARFGGAGLEPVERFAVRAELRQGDLGPGDVSRRERRVPTPITCNRGHGPNVPVATNGSRTHRQRPLQ